jgi:hypothetical protein
VAFMQKPKTGGLILGHAGHTDNDESLWIAVPRLYRNLVPARTATL